MTLGKILAPAGFDNAVMLDSGASTSAYKGKSLVSYVPRPVPHVVALIPPAQISRDCAIALKR